MTENQKKGHFPNEMKIDDNDDCARKKKRSTQKLNLCKSANETGKRGKTEKNKIK